MSIVVIITICSHCHSSWPVPAPANPSSTSMGMKGVFLVGVEEERNAWKIGEKYVEQIFLT